MADKQRNRNKSNQQPNDKVDRVTGGEAHVPSQARVTLEGQHGIGGP